MKNFFFIAIAASSMISTNVHALPPLSHDNITPSLLSPISAKLIEVGDGYAGTSVNTPVFRGSSIVSHGNHQFTSFYDKDGNIVVAKRQIGDSVWDVKVSQYKGNVTDAHNVISLGIDGEGFLHLSFDHHGNPLKYVRSLEAGSLDLGEQESMTGRNEKDVTYPEFYTLPDGDLLFAYRSGESGRGNLILNRYDVKTKSWERLQDILIDGEDARNAYWQIFVDTNGTIHLSWVWRESWLVETNHDLCYAKSIDGGKTWQKSDGSPYNLPITLETAEVAWNIPQNSELINQTGMSADMDGNPLIATYWRDENSRVPQYRLVRHNGEEWIMTTIGNRKAPFSLSGGGTKMIPISRPRIISDGKSAFYLFRDEERGSKVSMAYTKDLQRDNWEIRDLTDFSVDAWEPTYDINLWNNHKMLNIFVQTTHQGDGEKISDSPETFSSVYILEPSFE